MTDTRLGRRHKDYLKLADDSLERYQGFVKLEEYKYFYLCGKYDGNGDLMYRECFSKFDVDKRNTRKKSREPWHSIR